jgi:hypothetical protein
MEREGREDRYTPHAREHTHTHAHAHTHGPLAAAARGLGGRGAVDVDGPLPVPLFGGRVDEALLDVPGEGEEGLLDPCVSRADPCGSVRSGQVAGVSKKGARGKGAEEARKGATHPHIPMLDLALVSMNLTPNSSASACPWSLLITFFSSMSHLLPTRILLTPSLACCSMFRIQFRMSVAWEVGVPQAKWGGVGGWVGVWA